LGGLARKAAPLVPGWSNALKNADRSYASVLAFISKYFTVFNLIPLKKVTDAKSLKDMLGSHWHWHFDAMLASERLYVLDMTIFDTLESPTIEYPRFTKGQGTFGIFSLTSRTLGVCSPLA